MTFNIFKRKTASQSKATPSDAELDSLYGGKWMSTEKFLALADRVAGINNYVDWLYQAGGSAGGKLERSCNLHEDKLRCILRPIHNSNLDGLVFDAQIGAVPPQSLGTINALASEMTRLMDQPTGSEIYVFEQVLWLKTLIAVEQESEFTDEILEELIVSNFELGELCFKAFVRVHQGAISPKDALLSFCSFYKKYLECSSSAVQEAYLSSRVQRWPA